MARAGHSSSATAAWRTRRRKRRTERSKALQSEPHLGQLNSPGEALSPQTLEAVEWGFAPRPWRGREEALHCSSQSSEAKIPSVFKLAVVGGQKPQKKNRKARAAVPVHELQSSRLPC